MTVNPQIDAGTPWVYAVDHVPTTADSNYSIPTLWITETGLLYVLTNNTPGAAVWAHTPKEASAAAWVNFNGADGSINSNYNIASVVRNSTGNYTIAFSSVQSDANYTVSICATGSCIGGIPSQATSSFTISTSQVVLGLVTAVDPTIVTVLVF